MPLKEESNIHGQANYSDSVLPSHMNHAHNIQPLAPVINSGVSALSYEELQLGNPDSWDSCTNLIFMFGQTTSQEIDVYNIKYVSLTSLTIGS